MEFAESGLSSLSEYLSLPVPARINLLKARRTYFLRSLRLLTSAIHDVGAIEDFLIQVEPNEKIRDDLIIARLNSG